MPKRKVTWTKRKSLNYLTSWLADRDIDYYTDWFERELADPNVAPHYVAYLLAVVGVAPATEGAIRVLRGDESGWKLLHLGWRYRAFELCVWTQALERAIARVGGVFKPGKTGVPQLGKENINRASLCLAQAIATGEDGFAHWCGDRLVRHLLDNDEIADAMAWSPLWVAFEPFMFWLYAKWRGREFDLEAIRREINLAEVYQRIINAWDDEASLAEALVAACEYHVKHSRKDDDAFSNLPYEAFPVEVLALQRVRRELKLPVPYFEHPLIDDNPLAEIPDPFPKSSEDERLNRALERCRSQLPDLYFPA